jgi:hypothetical protein
MRLKAILLTIAMGALALASQGGVKLERKYKEGEKDAYKMTMQMSLTGGLKVDIRGNYSQTVKKVYENGEADVENAVTDIVANMMGTERKQQSAKPSTIRMSKYGTPVGDTEGSQSATFMVYSATLGDREVKVGASYPVKYSDPNKPGQNAEGTITVESLANGVVTLATKMNLGQPSPAKPMHMESKAVVDLDTGKPSKVEGTVSGAQFQGGGPVVESMKFTFERVK